MASCHISFFFPLAKKTNAKKAAGLFLCQAATSRELLGSLAAASLNSVTQCTCFPSISRLSLPSGRTFSFFFASCFAAIEQHQHRKISAE